MNLSKTLKKGTPVNSKIQVNITDFILTPLSCGALINEIIKSLLHQKSQIPYSYSWLKHIVNTKRSTDSPLNIRTNFTLSNHFKSVSKAFDVAENVMKEIINEFRREYKNHLKEIVIVFGSTTVTPKEVFSIRLPTNLPLNHLESNHQVDNSKKIQKVLRDIFLSEAWMGLLDNSLPCTNTHFYLKKCSAGLDRIDDSIFMSSKPLFIAQNIKHIIIDLIYENTTIYSCCNHLKVFNDCDSSCDIEDLGSRKNDDINIQSDENDIIWVLSKTVVQGFKDCFINKVPASELW